jgi:hypothetical protein
MGRIFWFIVRILTIFLQLCLWTVHAGMIFARTHRSADKISNNPSIIGCDLYSYSIRSRNRNEKRKSPHLTDFSTTFDQDSIYLLRFGSTTRWRQSLRKNGWFSGGARIGCHRGSVWATGSLEISIPMWWAMWAHFYIFDSIWILTNQTLLIWKTFFTGYLRISSSFLHIFHSMHFEFGLVCIRRISANFRKTSRICSRFIKSMILNTSLAENSSSEIDGLGEIFYYYRTHLKMFLSMILNTSLAENSSSEIDGLGKIFYYYRTH